MALEKIKLLMKNKGINQEELANISGVPKSTLGKILAGISSNPTLDTMKAIANALDCSLDDFDEKTKISESNAFAQTNKYENITTLLDQLNPKGIAEAERHTKYLTTQDEYVKNKEILTFKANENKLIAYGGGDVQISKEEYDELVEQSRKDRKTKGWE